MRVENKHTAEVAGIAPGQSGDVDEKNAGIKVFVEAGFLVLVEESKKKKSHESKETAAVEESKSK